VPNVAQPLTVEGFGEAIHSSRTAAEGLVGEDLPAIDFSHQTPGSGAERALRIDPVEALAWLMQYRRFTAGDGGA
jgi:hypothetical protein